MKVTGFCIGLILTIPSEDASLALLGDDQITSDSQCWLFITDLYKHEDDKNKNLFECLL